jgi:hypothetical protein
LENPIDLLKFTFNSSGGFYYHLKALRYKNNLWRPYQNHLHQWLKNVTFSKSKLFLVGPSGGYSLKSEFLSQFSTIKVAEPDPMARYLLKRNHPGIYFQWSSKNHLKNSAAFKTLFDDNQDCQILFCNLLGQIPYFLNGFQESVLKEIKSILEEYEWVSYHDRISSCEPFKNMKPLGPKLDSISINGLVKEFWDNQKKIEVRDHLTGQLFNSFKGFFYIPWVLDPRNSHLIECVKNL